MTREHVPTFGAWLDMATAPTDGTRILIVDAAWRGELPRQVVTQWHPWGGWDDVTHPTHWMPLPASPEENR